MFEHLKTFLYFALINNAARHIFCLTPLWMCSGFPSLLLWILTLYIQGEQGLSSCRTPWVLRLGNLLWVLLCQVLVNMKLCCTCSVEIYVQEGKRRQGKIHCPAPAKSGQGPAEAPLKRLVEAWQNWAPDPSRGLSVPRPSAMCVPVWSVMFSSLGHMVCSPPGSSVHGILWARKLEWGVGPFLLRGIVQTQGSIRSLLCLLHWQVGSLSLVSYCTPNSPTTLCGEKQRPPAFAWSCARTRRFRGGRGVRVLVCHKWSSSRWDAIALSPKQPHTWRE